MFATKLQAGIQLVLDREGVNAMFDIHDNTLFIGDADSSAYTAQDLMEMDVLGFCMGEGSFTLTT